VHQPVTIYTKKNCPYCIRVKDLLAIKGLEYTEYDINNPIPKGKIPENLVEAEIPLIYIGQRKLGGCARLFELDEAGELDKLL